MPAKRRRGRFARVTDALLTVAVLGLLFLVVARLERLSVVNPLGVARVADGDSLEIAGERIRLRGIDAPELNQKCRRDGSDFPCGRQAAEALKALTEQRDVSCRGWERDRYGRLLATCSAGGVELNKRQVTDGWAVAYGGYETEERTARAEGRGIWSSDFERPSQWRATHGELSESPHDLSGMIGNWLRQLVGG